MTVLEIVLSLVVVILLGGLVTMGIIIRGAISRESIKDEQYGTLTGRQIEAIRLKLISVGVNAVTKFEVMNVIHTVRAIQLGTYDDIDPYIPADIYSDVDDKVFVK
jgi:hypothetical protein